MTATGFGSGKLILVGEHAVVYGHPAIAFAVDRGTTVTLARRDGPTRLNTAGPQDDALREAIALILGPHGWTVTLETSLPIGRGMGSSAALSVALVRAKAAHDGHGEMTPDAVFDAALPLERVFHANPSGLDVAIAARGGAIRYVRATPPELSSLPTPAGHLLVLDTGKVGNTGELVSGVGSRRPGIDPTLDRIGCLVDEARHVLNDPPALGELLTENHAHLRTIGVSTPELDGLVAWSLQHGAHGAKLSGAGGGGVVIALTSDPEAMLNAANQAGHTAWICHPEAMR